MVREMEEMFRGEHRREYDGWVLGGVFGSLMGLMDRNKSSEG